MKSVKGIKPINGIPYCKEHGTIYLEKVNMKNTQSVVGYKVPCRCKEYEEKKKNEDKNEK